MKKLSAFLMVMLAVGFVGCSSCSSNNQGTPGETGTDTTASDGDTDSDTDADSDSDTDTGNIVDAGPWDWEDLPAGEDCGTGCKQLTFTERVKMLEWDVWGDRLVFLSQDHSTDTGNWVFRIQVVDIANEKTLTIPKPYPDLPEGGFGYGVFSPTTKETQEIFYSTKVYSTSPEQIAIIRVDLESNLQEFLWILESDESGDHFEHARSLDVYGDRLVTRGGCSNAEDIELCLLTLDGSTEPQMLAGSLTGEYNSIWEDVVVWTPWGDLNWDIKGYDFNTEQFIFVTQDEEVQINPRINGTKVAYQDLRFGDSGLEGDWNHSAIFVKDIQIEQTTQVTSGEWIGVHPDVYGNIVVWADYRDSTNPNHKDSVSGVEIWGYNLDTETEFQITNLPGRTKTTPRIWGDKVFVHMYKLDSAEDAIYMFDLPSSAK